MSFQPGLHLFPYADRRSDSRSILLTARGPYIHHEDRTDDAQVPQDVIDLVLLCQSLSDTGKRRFLEKAHAIRPDLKCAVFSDDGRELKLDGTEVSEKVDGPSGLLKATGKLLIQKNESQTVVSV